jgi:phage-related protein
VTESSYDLNGRALPSVTTTTSYDCHSTPTACYGNATQITVSTGDGYSKTTTNTYNNDATNWHLGRLIRSTVTSTTP